jgi:hypothetical protein
MPLTQDRLIKTRAGTNFNDPLAATTKIFAGSLVALNAAGYLVPGATATTLVARGVAQEQVDNSAGIAGDKSCESRPGIYPFKNSASTDLITRAEIGDDCYIVDDQTVAKTNGTTTRSVAGKIVDIDSDGVWVRVGI